MQRLHFLLCFFLLYDASDKGFSRLVLKGQKNLDCTSYRAEDLEQEQGGIQVQPAHACGKVPGPRAGSCHPLSCPEKEDPRELAGCSGLPRPCAGHPSSRSGSA